MSPRYMERDEYFPYVAGDRKKCRFAGNIIGLMVVSTSIWKIEKKQKRSDEDSLSII